MDEILKTIVESLVDNKDSISIKKNENADHIRYNVTVSSDEMGMIIGRHGKIAKAIRTLMKPVASKEHKTVEVEFIDA